MRIAQQHYGLDIAVHADTPFCSRCAHAMGMLRLLLTCADVGIAGRPHCQHCGLTVSLHCCNPL
jgi:hypothetical protein